MRSFCAEARAICGLTGARSGAPYHVLHRDEHGRRRAGLRCRQGVQELGRRKCGEQARLAAERDRPGRHHQSQREEGGQGIWRGQGQRGRGPLQI